MLARSLPRTDLTLSLPHDTASGTASPDSVKCVMLIELTHILILTKYIGIRFISILYIRTRHSPPTLCFMDHTLALLSANICHTHPLPHDSTHVQLRRNPSYRRPRPPCTPSVHQSTHKSKPTPKHHLPHPHHRRCPNSLHPRSSPPHKQTCHNPRNKNKIPSEPSTHAFPIQPPLHHPTRRPHACFKRTSQHGTMHAGSIASSSSHRACTPTFPTFLSPRPDAPHCAPLPSLRCAAHRLPFVRDACRARAYVTVPLG